MKKRKIIKNTQKCKKKRKEKKKEKQYLSLTSSFLFTTVNSAEDILIILFIGG